MATAATNTVMQRKLANARNGAATGSRSALRALRRAWAKAAADTAGLALAVIGATQDRITHEDLAARLAGDRMLLLLDGPAGQTGVLWVDRDAVSAIVQVQTTGQLSAGPPGARPYTSTDAALVQPVIDAALTLAERLVEAAADRACLTGYRFGAMAEDAAGLILEIDAERLRSFDLTLDFAAGLRQGALGLILPEEPPQPEAGDGAVEQPPRALLPERAVGALRVELQTAICRIRLPFAEFAALQPGDLLELRDARLDATELLSIAGRRVAIGQLGQAGGFRAIRLLEADPATAHLRPARVEGFSATSVPPTGAARQAGGDAAASKAKPVPMVIDEDDDDPLGNLPTELAVAEISELAGLPAPGQHPDFADDEEV